MTARPWPDGTRPTAAQLLEWLRDPDAIDRADDDGDRLLVLDRLLTAAEQADRCLLMDHDNLGRELDHTRRALYTELIHANRYRLAWTSARRRAQGLTDGIARAMTAIETYRREAHDDDR